MRTVLAEMGHIQPPTPGAIDSTAENSTVNGTAKQKRSRAIDMILYWFRDRTRKNHFHIFWEEEKKYLSYYVTKNHPIWNHRAMRPIYAKTNKKQKTEKTGKLGPGECVTEPTIPGEPRKRIIPLRESVIIFPRTWIIPLRESRI